MKINELNITITKAVITSITLSLSDDGLDVDVSGGLFTDGGKQVSTFNFDSDSYCEDRKFDIPAYINSPAREIFEQLTPIIYKKINGEFNMLKAKNE